MSAALTASLRGLGDRPGPPWKGAGLYLLLTCPALLSMAGPGSPAPGRLPEPGETRERQLAGGQTHRYALEPQPGEELWLTVVQDGIDVVVSIVAADGEALLTVDNPSGPWGQEWLLFRAEAPAIAAAVEIRPFAAHSAPGRYRLRVASRFPAEVVDHRLSAARRAVTEAGQLNRAGTREAWRRALGHYREALAGWQELGRDAEAARTLFNIAVVHRRLDQHRDSLALLRRALAEWRSLGERLGEAQALMEIASTARMLGEGEYVEATYRQALDLWRDLGDLHGQARTLSYLGLVRARTAPHSALELYRRALALFRRIGNVREEAVTLNSIGGIHDLLGEPHPALAHYRRALDVHQRLGDPRQEAVVWNNVASVHRRSGKLEEALEGYSASLEVRRQLDDRRGQGRVLNNIGLTRLALGDASRARDTLREALRLRRESEDRRGEAITLHNLGRVHAELEEWGAAMDLWTRALALRRQLRDRSGEATTLISMGRAAGRLGRPAARQHLEDALAILDEIDNPWRQAKAWWALGRILTISGEAEEAVSVLERSLRIFRATVDDVGEGDALLALARAERSLAARQAAGRQAESRLAGAYAHATAALDLLETVRADVDSLGLRASFLSHHGEAFEFTVDLAMELDRRDPSAGWSARALEISERARARSLLDLLKESGAGLRHAVDSALVARRQELLERLNAKVERRRRHLGRGGPSAESERLAAETGEVLALLEDVDNEIRRQSPAWDALVRPRPLRASAVRALLDPGTTLLEYSLGEERSFLWVVTAERIESFQLPGREIIEAAAREVYEGLRIHDPRARSTDAVAAARLSEMLLGPVAERLSGDRPSRDLSGVPSVDPPAGQRLAVVADGALHYLPFAALPHPTSSEPLLARHEIVSLPSASALAVQRQILTGRPVAKKALAVLADPVFGPPDPRLPAPGTAPGAGAVPITLAARDPAYRRTRSGEMRLDRLPWSRWEAESIAAHAGEGQALVALGFDADLEAVRGGRLEDYRIVHFATHGIVESEHPELSALVLSLWDAEGRSRDGFLRLPEIYNLDLGAELVVLSGCRTALGREIRGEGLVGLTRGFFAAGGRRLVASLWRVQDRSTAELMDRFYRRLLRDGRQLRPAAALRRAQLELISEPEFRDPYHWAAFAVYGDWR